MELNGIRLAQGFTIKSYETIDSRFVLSADDITKVGKAEYQADPDSLYNLGKWPEHYFALCTDDGQMYEFHKDATAPNGCVFTRLTRKIDERTILEGADLKIYVPIDNKTIFVGTDGLIHAEPEALQDGVATKVFYTSEEKEQVDVLFDDKSIKVSDNKLFVNIDRDSIKLDSEGHLYVDLSALADDFTIKVNSEGELEAQYKVADKKGLKLDGVTLEALVDDDTIVFDSEGNLKATFLRYEGSEAIDITDKFIGVRVDDETIEVNADNKLEVKLDKALKKDSEGISVKRDEHTIVLNANEELRVPVANLIHVDSEGILKVVERPTDEVVLSLRHDDTLAVTSEGLHVVAKPVIAGDAIRVDSEGDSSKVNVIFDRKSIGLGSEGLFVKLADALDVQRAGIKLDAIRGLYLSIDNSTIQYNSEGKLFAQATPLVAKDALKIQTVGTENQIKVLYDDKTIKLDDLVANDGRLYVPFDSETLIVDNDPASPTYKKVIIPLDKVSLDLNSEGKVYVKAVDHLIDGLTIIKNADGKIETAVGGYISTQSAQNFFNDYPTSAGGDFRMAFSAVPAVGDVLTFTVAGGTPIYATYEYKPGAGKNAVRFEYGGYEIYGYMDGTNFILDEVDGENLPADLFGGLTVEVKRELRQVFHKIDSRFFPTDDITIIVDADNKLAVNASLLAGEGLAADGKKLNVDRDDVTIILNSEGKLEAVDELPEYGTSEEGLFLRVTSEGTLEWAHAGKVDDVTIEGQTIVQNKVAVIPVATDSEKGVVKFDGDTLVLNSEEQLKVVNLVEDVLLKELLTTAVSSEGIRTKITSEATIVDPADRVAKLDLTQYSKLEETGYRIELFMDNEHADSEHGYDSESAYVLRARLLDQAGNVLTTSNPIDLPLESMIIDVKQEYGSEGSEGVRETILVFVLRNGKEIRIPLGSVVSGFITIHGDYEGTGSIYGIKNFEGELKNHGYEVVTQVQFDEANLTFDDSENFVRLIPYVASEGIEIVGKTVARTNKAGDTINPTEYTIKAKFDHETIILNSEAEMEVPIDRETIIVKDGLLVANIDSETVVLNSEGQIAVPIDNVTIVINSEGFLEAKGINLKEGDALHITDDSESTPEHIVKRMDVLYDSETVGLTAQNKLEVIHDKKTIVRGSEGLEVNLDKRTIIYNATEDYIEVPHDSETIQINSEGKFYIPLDGITVYYDESEGLVKAAGLVVSEGEAIRIDDSEIGGLPLKTINVRFDKTTIVLDSENNLSVPHDSETIILSEGVFKVNYDKKTLILDEGEGTLRTRIGGWREDPVDTTFFTLNEPTPSPVVTVEGLQVIPEIGNEVTIEYELESLGVPATGAVTFTMTDDGEWISGEDAGADIYIDGIRFKKNYTEAELILDPVRAAAITNLVATAHGETYVYHKVNGIYLPTDNKTIFVTDDAERSLKVVYRVDSERGLEVDSEERIYVKVDGVTIGFNSEGELTGTAELEAIMPISITSEGNTSEGEGKIKLNYVLPLITNSEDFLAIKLDEETVVLNSEGAIHANIDNDTLIINSEGLIAVDRLTVPEVDAIWYSIVI